MNKSDFTLVGAQETIKMFREFPEEGYRKAIAAGFKKAAIPVKKAIIAKIPGRIKKIKAAVKIKQSRRGLVLDVGFWASAGMYRNSRGKDWDPYQLAYWFNYGTYANRLTSHRFVKPRLRETRDKRGGIMPDEFVERAIEYSLPIATETLQKEWASQILLLCDKYGATK